MWTLVKFYQSFKVVLLQIHFESGAARIRTDLFRIRIRILLKVSDPQHGATPYLSKLFWRIARHVVPAIDAASAPSPRNILRFVLFPRIPWEKQQTHIGTLQYLLWPSYCWFDRPYRRFGIAAFIEGYVTVRDWDPSHQTQNLRDAYGISKSVCTGT